MNRIYLLDTNIVSEITKPNPNPNLLNKMRDYEEYSAISMITWSELWHGVSLLPESRKKELLTSFLIEKVQSTFPIIPQDEHSGYILSQMRVQEKMSGTTHQSFDLQIASTAVANNMILVTHNLKDFRDISSLMLEDWIE